MSSATLELLASRADVWAFVSEPYHLPDWWPGITGVEPDRRGFAPGARWKVHARKQNLFTGARTVETMLLVREVAPYERWSFHVLDLKLDAEVRLHATGADRTEVTVVVSQGNAKLAVKRLYDLVQTAAGI
jgi:uncharacterized protein YndB with AHSA1/START domain